MKGKDLRPVVYLKKGKKIHKVPDLYGGEKARKLELQGKDANGQKDSVQ